MCIITKTKVNTFRIYKTDIGLYNGSLSHEVPDEKWKAYLIIYSPIILLILPIILSFFSLIGWLSLLYVVTNAVFYKGNMIWVVFPSGNDITYINYWKYCRNHLLNFLRNHEISDSIKNGTYNNMLEKFNTLNFQEYNMKKNMKKF